MAPNSSPPSSKERRRRVPAAAVAALLGLAAAACMLGYSTHHAARSPVHGGGGSWRAQLASGFHRRLRGGGGGEAASSSGATIPVLKSLVDFIPDVYTPEAAAAALKAGEELHRQALQQAKTEGTRARQPPGAPHGMQQAGLPRAAPRLLICMLPWPLAARRDVPAVQRAQPLLQHAGHVRPAVRGRDGRVSCSCSSSATQ